MKASKDYTDADFFGRESVLKILLKIAPPVMFAQLIQSLYNMVDSYFVGKTSDDGLAALSAVYPLQLIIIALAIGTGVGVNTYMAKQYAIGKTEEADRTAGTGILLALITWLLFSVIAVLVMAPYAQMSVNSEAAVKYTIDYGIIVSVGSLGIFLESIFTKVHQAYGNMKLPMIAQVVGALTNIVLDPVLIFGIGAIPALGIRGAAIATVLGQCTAAVIVGIKGFRKIPKIKDTVPYIKVIYKLGYPSILMQSLYTVYIGALNAILAGFCDEAVTVLGLYYKLQSFFFIPLFGLETCIVPVLSYNYANNDTERCKKIFGETIIISTVFMVAGILCFELIPTQLIGIFSSNQAVKEIGKTAFRIIGISFAPAVYSLTIPIFFQAIGYSKTSAFLSILRQIICLVPIFYAFSKIGLDYSWIGFPVAETITDIFGIDFYIAVCRKWKNEKALKR